MDLDGDARESSETEPSWVLWLSHFKDEDVGRLRVHRHRIVEVLEEPTHTVSGGR